MCRSLRTHLSQKDPRYQTTDQDNIRLVFHRQTQDKNAGLLPYSSQEARYRNESCDLQSHLCFQFSAGTVSLKDQGKRKSGQPKGFTSMSFDEIYQKPRIEKIARQLMQAKGGDGREATERIPDGVEQSDEESKGRKK